MDFSKILKKKIGTDNDLSNRYIELDPNGYFIIKIDLKTKQIILEHYLNKINEEGYALDPKTNEPIKCDSKEIKTCNETFTGISAKAVSYTHLRAHET